MLTLTSRSIIIAFVLAAPMAQAGPDGRVGPSPFTDAALDQALSDMNAHLQARYSMDEMLTHLDVAPTADFVSVSVASAATPLDRPFAGQTEFGPAISGGASLNTHLVSFNQDLQNRGDDLFLRVARSQVTGFAEIARDVAKGPSDFIGVVRDDPTLDARMHDLNAGLVEFDLRARRLNPAQSAVTGASFDNYGDALKLMF